MPTTGRKEKERTCKPYPYRIPEVVPPKRLPTENIELWGAMEFFRIEALLRSPKFQEAYQRKDRRKRFRSLLIEYDIIFYNPLKGEHHVFLDPSQCISSEIKPFYAIEILPSKIVSRSVYYDFKIEEKECRVTLPEGFPFIDFLNPRFKVVVLDTTFPAEAILGKLRPYLQDRHRELKTPLPQKEHSPRNRTSVSIIPKGFATSVITTWPSKSPAINDVLAWLQFFRCYDLKMCEGGSFGKIALRVYDASKKSRNAKQAIQKVSKLIDCAVQKYWPPPSKLLKPS